MAHGLCDDCFWKDQCYYDIENPDEWVRLCEDDGGLSYAQVNPDGSVEWPDSYYERLKEEEENNNILLL